SQCYIGPVTDTSPNFSNVGIGTLDVGAVMADVFGFLATNGLDISSMTLVSGSSSITSNRGVEGFAFDDLAGGHYDVSISGMFTGTPIMGLNAGLYNGGLKVNPDRVVCQNA